MFITALIVSMPVLSRTTMASLYAAWNMACSVSYSFSFFRALGSHWICHTLLLQLAVSTLLLQLDVSTLLLHLDVSLQALMAWLAANGGHPAL